MKNTIPRKFKKIIGKMKIKTNLTDPEDEVHIIKNESNEYIGTNIKTGKTGLYFVSMLRNSNIFELTNVEI